jgi:hypothetical protein
VRVHHFLPGLVLLTAAGGGAILSRDDGHELLLSIPFGTGAGLALDRSACWSGERTPTGEASTSPSGKPPPVVW